MINNTLKSRERFSTTLDKKVINELKDYSKKTMIPISKILDKAITEYIQSNSK
jgi:metal-responsive CopG/Arc/MetJ family transcriptional regulator